MSLVMAAICTDGIVVSGDFRRSRITVDPETRKEKFERYDDCHKIFYTPSGRIIGITGIRGLKDGSLVEDAIHNMLKITNTMNLSVPQELSILAGVIEDNNNSLIEAGIDNGEKLVAIWNQKDGIFISDKGGAIGATESLNPYKTEIDTIIGKTDSSETAKLLHKYNKLVALHDPTVSLNCETLTIF